MLLVNESAVKVVNPSARSTAADVVMMSIFGASERDEDQGMRVFAAREFRVVKFHESSAGGQGRINEAERVQVLRRYR